MANGPRPTVRSLVPVKPGSRRPGGFGSIFSGGLFGGFGRFDLRFIFFPTIIFRPRRPRTKRRSPFDEQIPELFQPTQPVPVPTVPPVASPPVRLPTRVPFPVERFGFGIRFGIAGVILVTFAEILRKAQENIAKELERERQADERFERRRAAEGIPLPEILFPSDLPDPAEPLPEIFVRPDIIEIPVRAPAVPEPLPEFIEIPDVPAPQVEVEVIPDIQIPAPVVRPIAVPAAAPVRPLEIVFPTFFDVPLFRTPTVPLPIGTPPDLTPIAPGVPPSLVPGLATTIGTSLAPLADPLAEPQPQPDAKCVCPPRRCDDEVDQDQPRTQCFKGLYREGPLETDFTKWTEVDCFTGREL